MPHRDVPVRSIFSTGFAIFVVACSGTGDSRAPYAVGVCSGTTCGATMFGGALPVRGGSSAPDGGAGTGAMVGSSGGSTQPINCSSEFGVTLCLSTAACPGIVLDASQFPSCGFQGGTSSIGVECVCNGTQLCPIGAVASCADLPNLLQQQTIADICNQVTVTGACRDLGSGLASGAVNTTACDRNCAATCDNTPICLAACGC